MYDSRSSHPFGGTHHLRSNREMGEGDRIEWGSPRTRVMATAAYGRAVIAEGLAEMAEPTHQTRRTSPVRPEAQEARMSSSTRSENRRQAALTRQAIERQTARRTPYLAEADPLAPVGNIRRPRTAKQPWRTEGEPFDPAKVSKTLSPRA